jgi:uncharacterized membrane protein (UPF0127 family)
MFKKILIIVSLGAVVLAAFSYWNFRDKNETPQNSGLEEKTIYIGNKKIEVEVADEPMEQLLGLSGRKSLAQGKGMLFIFPTPVSPGFWMKDMKFSIDIIWITDNGMIIGIEKNIAPETFPNNFFPPSLVKYVLEVPAGWSEKNSIKVGDKMTL